jgi:hypothetical protein
MGTERELLRGRWRYDFLQFGVRPHPAEVFVFIDVGQVAIAFFLGFLQALQAAIHVASFGVDLRQHVGIPGAFFRTRDLGGDAHSRFLFQRIRVQFHGSRVFRYGTLQSLLAEACCSQVYVKRCPASPQEQPPS